MNRNYAIVGVSILALFFVVYLYDLNHRLSLESQARKELAIRLDSAKIKAEAKAQAQKRIEMVQAEVDEQKAKDEKLQADLLEGQRNVEHLAKMNQLNKEYRLEVLRGEYLRKKSLATTPEQVLEIDHQYESDKAQIANE